MAEHSRLWKDADVPKLNEDVRYRILRYVAECNPGETIEVPGTDIMTERLVCFENRRFRRCYADLREGLKPCEWMHFSRVTLEFLQRFIICSNPHLLLELTKHIPELLGLLLNKMQEVDS